MRRRWIVGVLALGAGVLGCGDDGAGTGDGGAGPCATDVDCDDGVFCNGPELCRPDATSADARGCVPTGTSCLALQTCDEEADVCITDCGIDPDADSDGADAVNCGGTDCDDSDPRRYPGNTEICDPAGLDEDCDPNTLASGAGNDGDGDGFVALECCNTQPDGSRRCGTDCDDGELGGEVNPAASEICNGVDEDCDGTIDEEVGGGTFYPDCDGDGFGRTEGSAMGTDGMCMPPVGTPDVCPDGSAALWALNDRDCDDADADVRPGVSELCNGKDDDCDGSLSDMEDADGDGVAQLGCGGTDCDDGDPSVGGCALDGVTTLSWVVARPTTGVEGAEGTLFGFDLDGRDSSAGDAAGCNFEDRTSPWGETGVDANFPPGGGIAFDRLFERYGDGRQRLYILVELSGIDGCDDTEATLSLYEARFVDPVATESDGSITPGQSVATAGPAIATIPVSIADGILLAEDISYAIPGGLASMTVDDGRARAACLSPDRMGYLLLGGYRSVPEAESILEGLADPDMMMGGAELAALADGGVPGASCADHISEAWYFGDLVGVTRAGEACRFADCDLDGFGSFAETGAECLEFGAGMEEPDQGDPPTSCPSGRWVPSIGDCDDGDDAINPNAPEICNGVDDDCDGVLSDLWRFGRDLDGDGAIDAACGGTDCQNEDPTKTECDPGDVCVLPDAFDPEPARCEMPCRYLDCDGDGVADRDRPLACGEEEPEPSTECPSGNSVPAGGGAGEDDCDDTDPTIRPGIPELCDAIDHDCDGSPGSEWLNRDSDGDGVDDVRCGGDDCFPLDGTETTCPIGESCDAGSGMPMCV